MPTTFRVDITSTAEEDIKEIWGYIARDDSETATRFIQRLKRRIETLERFPLRCPLISENALMQSHFRHLIYGKYRIIFRVAGSTVIVVRVIQGARLLHAFMLEL
jgi:toxin ParE1/3/4